MTSFLDFQIKDESSYEFNDMNEIVPGLWLGSQPSVIPSNIKYVFSMIGQQSHYIQTERVNKGELKVTSVYFEDKPEMSPEKLIHDLAEAINVCRQDGAVLVHCMAGMNRSGMVLGLALVKSGMESKQAIKLMRAKRSPSVLFNKVFHDWLLNQ
jgi:protein-tyrosine phosphatase